MREAIKGVQYHSSFFICPQPVPMTSKNGLEKTKRRIKHWWMSIIKKLEFSNIPKTEAGTRVMDFSKKKVVCAM